ncbi:MAG: hypothetical protein EAS49_15190, partial [Brucella intermedia]
MPDTHALSGTLTVHPDAIKPRNRRINLQSEIIGEKVFADKQRTKTGEIFAFLEAGFCQRVLHAV